MTFNPVFVEIDASKKTPRDEFEINDQYAVGLPSTRKKVLLLAPLLAAGSASDGDLVEGVGSIDDVNSYCGLPAKHIAEALFAKQPAPDLDLLCLAEAAGTAATFTLTAAVEATGDGTARIYAGNKYVDVTITEGDTPAEVATAIYTAIAADSDFPCTAADPEAGAVVTCTDKLKGTLGNNYYIVADVTSGIGTTVTPTQPTIGATDPTIDSTVTALYQERDYDLIIIPWNFTGTSLTALKNAAAYMANAARGHGAQHLEVHKGTYSATATRNDGISRRDWVCINSKTTFYMPMPAHVAAGHVGGMLAAEADPSVPFINEDCSDLLAPVASSYTQPTAAEIENGMNAGVPTFGMNDAGDLYIPQVITTATKLSGGAVSDAWASPHVFWVMKYTRKAIAARLKSTYSTRASNKMVDGKPADVKGQILAVLQTLADRPLQYLSAEMLLKYKSQIVVRVSATNPKFIEIGIPTPVIAEYRGTLGVLFLQVPSVEALAA